MCAAKRRDNYIRAVFILAATAIVGLSLYRLFFSQSRNTPTELQLPPSGEDRTEPTADTRRQVKRVIDGDTLVMADSEVVRLIGVDTPETHHPELPLQRFGEEAAAFTRKMVEGLKVTLEFDDPREDAYGRTLAYVLVDGALLNREIIRRGYGYAYTRFRHSRESEFIEAEQEARAKGYGLWNYSLTDGRIANLTKRYELLNPEGKRELEMAWDELLERYPAPRVKGAEE